MIVNLTMRALGDYNDKVFIFNLAYLLVAIIVCFTSTLEICGMPQGCLAFVLLLATLRCAVRAADFEGFTAYSGVTTYLFDTIGNLAMILIYSYF